MKSAVHTIPQGATRLRFEALASIMAMLLISVVLLAGASASAQTNYQRIKSFGIGNPGESGFFPAGAILRGSDGKLYGVTTLGGTNRGGTVFSVNKDGNNYQVLHHFGNANGDGSNPASGLIEASDGLLYGTTSMGGTLDVAGVGHGTIYRLQKDGTSYQILHAFTPATGDGDGPPSKLIEGSDGALYGTTTFGGPASQVGLGAGTIFKISKNGAAYSIIHSFAYSLDDGANPYAGLIMGSDGALYGTTGYGGSDDSTAFSGNGTIFKLNADGGQFTLIHRFPEPEEANRNTTVVEGPDGRLFGATDATVFALKKDGSNFVTLQPGSGSIGGLLVTPSGVIYSATPNGSIYKMLSDGSGYTALKTMSTTDLNGTAYPVYLTQNEEGKLLGLLAYETNYPSGILFSLSADGAEFQALHAFIDEASRDGAATYAGVYQAQDGFLYGTSTRGGTNNNGIVFRIQTNGTAFSIIHHFDEVNGVGSYARVIEGSDGRIYGTSSLGGSLNAGMIYRMEKTGEAFTVLRSFTGMPVATADLEILQASDGLLYGSTARLGPGEPPVVFRMERDGANYTELHSLTNFTNAPRGPSFQRTAIALMEGTDTKIYGVTLNNGLSNSGMIFRLTKDGGEYDVMLSFPVAEGEGKYPSGPLLETSDGYFYSTTSAGGIYNFGTLYKVKRDGSGYQTIHSFAQTSASMALPLGGLVEGNNGVLYGTTLAGGTDGQGTVYKINKDGSGYDILHSFSQNSGDGRQAFSRLFKASNGDFYGTTSAGGGFNLGTIFRLFSAKPAVSPSYISISPNGARIGVVGGAATREYHLQATTTPSQPESWLSIATNTAAIDGSFEYVDTDSANHPIRFYRGVSP